MPLLQAKPLGLIINELAVNAMKYAFPDGRDGIVDIEFRREGDHYLLFVRDNGIGMDLSAAPKGTGLGRRITQALTAQIGGTIEIRPGPNDARTECVIRWSALP